MRIQPPVDDLGDYERMRCEIIHPTIVDRHGNEQCGDAVFGVTTESGEWCLPCPYGGPGDHLWVRETFTTHDRDPDGYSYEKPFYRADVTDPYGLCFVSNDESRYVEHLRWTPSIHMPRWASRITLRIKSMRVERLQEISDDDCRAEGCSGGHIANYQYSATPLEHYRHIWESINGPGSWEENPFVWVIEFEKL